MSEVLQHSKPPSQNTILPLALVVIAVLVLVPLFILLGRADGLGRSAVGLDGLGVWLRENGVATITKPPRNKNDLADKVLRIIPIYDANFDGEKQDPADAVDQLGTETQRPLSRDVFQAKAAAGTTLAVLPKWRSGVIETEQAHPTLLIEEGRIRFYGEAVRRTNNRGFATYRLSDLSNNMIGDVDVYSLQVLGNDLDKQCDPLIIIADVGTVLAQCWDMGDNADSFLVLSDPDLVDNHGLALGNNAAAALKIVSLAGTQPKTVFIDNVAGQDSHAGSGSEASSRDIDSLAKSRSLSDLSRFFEYPLSYVWAGLVLLTALAIWRGIARFGAPVEERENSDSSKRRTIEASGRILHLAGSQRDLIQAHVQTRLDAVAGAILPPRRSSDAGISDDARIARLLGRRSPSLADRFTRAVAAVTNPNAAPHEQFAALDLFEKTLQEIWNEFGRSANTSR